MSSNMMMGAVQYLLNCNSSPNLVGLTNRSFLFALPLILAKGINKTRAEWTHFSPLLSRSKNMLQLSLALLLFLALFASLETGVCFRLEIFYPFQKLTIYNFTLSAFPIIRVKNRETCAGI